MSTLQMQADGRALVSGPLNIDSVASLLEPGSALIGAGQMSLVDLSGVSASDSAALALLIEWLSVARKCGKALRYEHIPQQLQQLARLSEVEELLLGA